MDGIIVQTPKGPVGLNDDGTLQVGDHGRLVPLDKGFAIEVKDASGNWIRQSTWQQ